MPRGYFSTMTPEQKVICTPTSHLSKNSCQGKIYKQQLKIMHFNVAKVILSNYIYILSVYELITSIFFIMVYVLPYIGRLITLTLP